MRAEEAAALVPSPFAEQISRHDPEGGPSGADWLAELPRLLAGILDEWGLSVDGSPAWGQTALVVPVRGDVGPAALKVVWPHPEARAEHLALRAWDGRGAVRLLRADPGRWVLLLERLTIEDLGEMWDEEACRVVGGLYRELHLPALPQLPRLSAWTEQQVADLHPRLPRALATRARSLAARLVADPACDATLVHGDLHYANVLSDGTEWVAIDPKPMAGHPAFEVASMLWNRTEEMGTGPAFRYLLRRRVEVLCEAGALAWDDARDWSVVREVVNASWALADGDDARVSLAMTIVKALGD
ncbi:streptomycin 6-kinase [Janibacter alkaliphilus]|uniref:Streptomycin 6-kinase n=1 Tax=Janibacter alkaliphilus TaxID=1069963 RepID=A0A852X432_9MICO|nr:streptomycin 6-kinase [Janibacter alkaliphilus]